MNINIRQATINDLESLSETFDQYRMFYGQASDKEKAKQFLFDRFEHNESIIFGAYDTDTNEVLGFTQLYPLFSSVSMQRLWLLNDLFVKKKYRQLHIGRTLMDQAKEYAVATKAKGLTLSTAVTNTIAQYLYEQLGYEKETDFYQYFLKL
jgi:ribosomal protein S18 acetylase RimI-like enzyme